MIKFPIVYEGQETKKKKHVELGNYHWTIML